MAKIAVITKDWNESARALALSLHQCRHDVTVITSKNIQIEESFPFPILTTFKNWSSREVLQFFPRFFGQAPEIWHFVFSDPQSERPGPGHWLLALLVKSLPRRVIAASIFSGLTQTWRWSPFLKMCDITTLPTRESLMHLKRRGRFSAEAELEIFPPLLLRQSQKSQAPSSEIDNLIENLGNYLVIPSDRFPESPEWAFVEDFHRLVILGPRRWQQKKRTYVSQNLSEADFERLLLSSKALLIAFSDLSPTELMRCHQWAEKTGKPVIASPRQAEALPGLCVHQKSGWVLDRGIDSLRTLLLENPELILPDWQKRPRSYSLMDSCLNELNRLYSKVQLKKSRI
jgi:hypothetical protein